MRPLYAYWARTSVLPLECIHLLFGGERYVFPQHTDSNYALVMEILLAHGVPAECSITCMEADNPYREAVAKAYEEMLPDIIDVLFLFLFLGVGTDGHIASLFHALRSGSRSVVPITVPKPPYERLTRRPKVIGLPEQCCSWGGEGRGAAEALNDGFHVITGAIGGVVAGW
jgi:6-phosphogluconolactonase/glucosamine-6-phosphate isomerase/deaminase